MLCMCALARCCCLSNTLPDSWFSFLSEQTADEMDGGTRSSPHGERSRRLFRFRCLARRFRLRVDEVNMQRETGHGEIKGEGV